MSRKSVRIEGFKSFRRLGFEMKALNPEDIVFVENVYGTTETRRLSDRSDLDTWLKDYSLGELWQMGEIGGRP